MCFERVFDTSPTTGSGATASEVDHEWTGIEERFCSHHRDVGPILLSEVVGTSPSDVLNHMGALGVEMPAVPLLGSVCPSCGRRMPVAGEGAARGICDACNARLRMEMRASWDSERAARAVASRLAMGEWRADGKGLSEVREGDTRG